MEATADLVLNGIIYCLKGMEVNVIHKTGKYSYVERVEKDGDEDKHIKFKVSNDLMSRYFAE